MAPSERGASGASHASWKNAANKDHITHRSWVCPLRERSASTPVVKPPWGLHDVPEDATACQPLASRGGGQQGQENWPRLNSCGGSSVVTSSSSQASYGSMLRRQGRAINQQRRHTLLSGGSSAASSSPSLRSSGELVFYNDHRELTPGRPCSDRGSVALSHLTSISQRSSASLRLEVEKAVQDEVARAIRPLQERLASERSKRIETELKLQKVMTPQM